MANEKFKDNKLSDEKLHDEKLNDDELDQVAGGCDMFRTGDPFANKSSDSKSRYFGPGTLFCD